MMATLTFNELNKFLTTGSSTTLSKYYWKKNEVELVSYYFAVFQVMLRWIQKHFGNRSWI